MFFFLYLGGTKHYKVLMDEFHHVVDAFLELGKGLVTGTTNSCLMLSDKYINFIIDQYTYNIFFLGHFLLAWGFSFKDLCCCLLSVS